MSRGPVHAGDVLRAAGALGVSDPREVRALVRAMGLPGPAPDQAGTPDPGAGSGPPRTDPLPLAGPRRPAGPPAAPLPRPARAADTAPGRERAASDGVLPAWCGSLLSFPAPDAPPRAEPASPPPDTPLFRPARTAVEVAPEPPWNPRTEQAILLAVAATEAAGREVDRRRLIELALRRPAGPLTGARLRVPYRSRPTTRAGLHVLLDRGPSMRPFRHDHQWLARLARRVVPPDQLRVWDFRLRQGVSADGGRTWRATDACLPPGKPVLLVSDLGHLRPPGGGRHQASPAEWLAFLRRLRRAGHTVTCLTPFGPQSYPPAVRQAVPLVPLDRRTSVWSARAEVRGARRPGRLP
jgi:hypothetical protein